MNSNIMSKVQNYLDLFQKIVKKTSDERVALVASKVVYPVLPQTFFKKSAQDLTAVYILQWMR